MFDFVVQNWMGLALAYSVGVTLLLVALGCVVFAASVWKPETAYDRLLHVRKLFVRS
jgi:hypothetical protein